MPISKSAKKALRVQLRKTAINRHRKVLVKAALKNVTGETAAKAISMVDKAAKWGIIHKNKAARLKSRLGKEVKPGSTKGTAEKKAAPAKKVTTAKKPVAKKPAAKKTATKAKK